jgi:hypothetical protein
LASRYATQATPGGTVDTVQGDVLDMQATRRVAIAIP